MARRRAGLVVVALALLVRRERVRPAGMLFPSLGLLPAARGSWRGTVVCHCREA